MTRSQKVKVSGLLLLAVMSIGVFALTPLGDFCCIQVVIVQERLHLCRIMNLRMARTVLRETPL